VRYERFAGMALIERDAQVARSALIDHFHEGRQDAAELGKDGS